MPSVNGPSLRPLMSVQASKRVRPCRGESCIWSTSSPDFSPFCSASLPARGNTWWENHTIVYLSKVLVIFNFTINYKKQQRGFCRKTEMVYVRKVYSNYYFISNLQKKHFYSTVFLRRNVALLHLLTNGSYAEWESKKLINIVKWKKCMIVISPSRHFNIFKPL